MIYSLIPTVAMATPTESFGDRASRAGIVSLQGMLTIFLVLAILWGAIEIMHSLLHRGEKKEKPAKKEAPSSAAPAAQGADDAAIAAAIAASLAATEDDGATVAAIVSAISAVRAEEGCEGGFRVVSFKRVGKSVAQRRF